MLVVVSVALWVAALLFTNFLYTGDFFRSGQHVNVSAVFDRPGGCVSWRNFLRPTFAESNLHQIISNALFQWSLSEYDPGGRTVARVFYYLCDGFLLIGLVRLISFARGNPRARCFLWSTVCFTVTLIVFFGSFAYQVSDRFFLRILPSIYIVDALGLVTLIGWLSNLYRPLQFLFRSLPLTHARFWSHVWIVQLNILILILLASAAVYIVLHPCINAYAWIPQVEFLEHASKYIPEPDALIISNFHPFYVDHFVRANTEREIVLLHRLQFGGDYYLQWKKPKHPEFIPEDIPIGSQALRYRRMYENGAQDMFKYTATDNPEHIREALAAGRRIYFICPSAYTAADEQALAILQSRYKFETIDIGNFQLYYSLPGASHIFMRNFFFGRVLGEK
jgi:hypothetical protein